MASKPKCKIYRCVEFAKTINLGCTCTGVYLVSAKNEKDAENILKIKIGKHKHIRATLQNSQSDRPYGTIENVVIMNSIDYSRKTKNKKG